MAAERSRKFQRVRENVREILPEAGAAVVGLGELIVLGGLITLAGAYIGNEVGYLTSGHTGWAPLQLLLTGQNQQEATGTYLGAGGLLGAALIGTLLYRSKDRFSNSW